MKNKKIIITIISMLILISILSIMRIKLTKNDNHDDLNLENTTTSVKANPNNSADKPNKTIKKEKKQFDYNLEDKTGLDDFIKSIDSSVIKTSYSTYVSGLHILSETNYDGFLNGNHISKIYEILNKYETCCASLFNNNKDVKSITYVQDIKNNENIYGNQIYIVVSRDKFENGCFSVLDGTKEGLDKFYQLGCIAFNGKIKALLEGDKK